MFQASTVLWETLSLLYLVNLVGGSFLKQSLCSKVTIKSQFSHLWWKPCFVFYPEFRWLLVWPLLSFLGGYPSYFSSFDTSMKWEQCVIINESLPWATATWNATLSLLGFSSRLWPLRWGFTWEWGRYWMIVFPFDK